MKPLRNFFDRIAPHFEKDGKYRKLYPVYEVIDSFFYTSDRVTSGTCHVRDAIEFKRMMSAALVALSPVVLMALYNTGLQANRAMETFGVSAAPGWRGALLGLVGVGYDPSSLWDNVAHGAAYFLPIYVVCMVVGILWEMLFCVVRNHELSEGFFVTGLIFPLTLPANIPLWQVALGTTFAVVVAKEIFGGTGRNFLNPALAGRAFLFFAYPGEISGDLSVWTAGAWAGIDGMTGATPLGAAMTAVPGEAMDAVRSQLQWWGVSQGTWWDALLGTMPGCMGETSALACLIGAAVLVLTGIASWRIMLSMCLGAVALSGLFCVIGSETNPMFEVPPHWHLVLGGFALGLVFMATDPGTAAITGVGQYIYGALIGVLVILVRVINPAFPEGVMLAILFGNTFAPLIDYYVVRANIRRRAVRYA
jgi:Na+-transporting NADH:ubiquinone oxidoreductase subunit B